MLSFLNTPDKCEGMIVSIRKEIEWLEKCGQTGSWVACEHQEINENGSEGFAVITKSVNPPTGPVK